MPVFLTELIGPDKNTTEHLDGKTEGYVKHRCMALHERLWPGEINFDMTTRRSAFRRDKAGA